MAKHYASADVFLFPSETATFGNVTLEAMASGLVVVAYNYAAARMPMTHGERIGKTNALFKPPRRHGSARDVVGVPRAAHQKEGAGRKAPGLTLTR